MFATPAACCSPPNLVSKTEKRKTKDESRKLKVKWMNGLKMSMRLAVVAMLSVSAWSSSSPSLSKAPNERRSQKSQNFKKRFDNFV